MHLKDLKLCIKIEIEWWKLKVPTRIRSGQNELGYFVLFTNVKCFPQAGFLATSEAKTPGLAPKWLVLGK